MKKNIKSQLKKKLVLNKETITTLTPAQQGKVVGGLVKNPSLTHCAKTN